MSEGGIGVSTTVPRSICSLAARAAGCCGCMRVRCDIHAGIGMRVIGGGGRGGRLNNTSAAARRVSSNFPSRFFRSKGGSFAPTKT